MADSCTHIGAIITTRASGDGCMECERFGGQWLHLRRCVTCGHVGCCDDSPHHHATSHHEATDHPLIQSYEPGEEWYWCYPQSLLFELDRPGPSPAHP